MSGTFWDIVHVLMTWSCGGECDQKINKNTEKTSPGETSDF